MRSAAPTGENLAGGQHNNNGVRHDRGCYKSQKIFTVHVQEQIPSPSLDAVIIIIMNT